MKPVESTGDSKLGMLEARLRFWLTVPSATGMHARLEEEIASHTKRMNAAKEEG